MVGHRYLVPLACICVLASATSRCHQAPSDPPRVAAIGASVTAGFRLSDYLDGGSKNPQKHIGKLLGRELTRSEYDNGVDSVRPGDVLAATYGTKVRTHADTFLFISPKAKARSVLTAAFKHELDLAIGIDLLFWFGYGTPRGQSQGTPGALEWRLERQAQGLALLDEFCKAHPKTTFIVGDYPDLTGAVPLMIQESMIPTLGERKELNSRLSKWANERPNVHVFKLSTALERLRSGKMRLAVGEDDRLIGETTAFQLARVHPNRLGVALLIRDLVEYLGQHVEPRLRPTSTAEQVIVTAAGVK